jgi:uncharacterized protein (DUF58 family)
MIPVPSPRLVRWFLGVAAASLLVLAFPRSWPLLLAANLTLLGSALLDWLLTPGPGRLRIERRAPPRLSVRQPEPVPLTLTNDSAYPLTVRVRDGVPESFRPSTAEVASVAPAGETVRLEYQVEPLARGLFHWGAIHVRYRSLLGLWERSLVVPAEAESRVYPNVSELERYHLLARTNHLEAMGIRKVRLRGGMWEFESLRDYASGDDVRLIDWKATARRRKLIVRNQEAERNQTVLLLLDCGRLMNAEVNGVAKLEHAISTVLVLAHVALSRGDRVGLCTFSGDVHEWVPPRPHLGHNRLLVETLYDLKGDYTETDHARCLRLVASRHPKRALLVVLTDFVDAETASEMVAHLQLAARRHLVLFTALRDPHLERLARQHPELPGDAFRKSVAVDLQRERREVLERLRQSGMHVLDVDPDQITAPLLNSYLEVAFKGLM